MNEAYAAPPSSQVVLVADASSAIGRATTLLLADGGASVFAVGTDASKMDDMPRETAFGGQVEVHAVEALHATACADAIARAHALYGRVDALVWAGIAIPFGPFESLSDAGFESVWRVNLMAPMRLVRAVIPTMRGQGHGHIIIVGSAAGRIGLPLAAAFSGTQHALLGMAHALRLELLPFEINVSVVESGLVRDNVVNQDLDPTSATLAPLPDGSPYAPLAQTLAEAVRARARQNSASPREVAQMVQRALTAVKIKSYYPVGRGTRRWLWARKILPEKVIDRGITRAMGLSKRAKR